MQLLQTLTALSVLLGSAYSTPMTKTGRTSPPSGCLTVGKSGKYSTFGAAVATLQGDATACIFIYPGTYPEQVNVKYDGPLTIYGYTTDVSSYSANTVTISSSVNAATAGSDAKSSALQLTSKANIKVYNINVANTYGPGHQAIAMTVSGNQASFYGCGFFGYQDTLYAKSGSQYYTNCYIEGAVDYIFGSAAAWFANCTLVSAGYGAITANNRASATDPSWYVIDSSTIMAKPGVDLIGQIWLGRPWGVAARVIFQNSALSNIINTAGWTTMVAGAMPTFEEFNNVGGGADVAGRAFETKATAAVTREQLFGNSWKQWVDTTY